MSTQPRRWPSRTAAKQANRRALLDAAWQLLQDKGYTSTSLADVAALAGTSTGPIYATFGSKLILFATALAERHTASTLRDVAPLGTPLPEAMALLARHWHRLATAPGARGAASATAEIAAAYLTQPDEDTTRALTAMSQASLSALAADIEQFADASGHPLHRNPRDIAAAFQASIHGMSQAAVAGSQTINAELFEATARALLHLHT